MKLRHAALAALAAALLPFACVQITERPSNRRDWSPDQAVLARAEFDGERVTVRNVRNFEYRSVHEYAVRYETRSYLGGTKILDLDKAAPESVDGSDRSGD